MFGINFESHVTRFMLVLIVIGVSIFIEYLISKWKKTSVYDSDDTLSNLWILFFTSTLNYIFYAGIILSFYDFAFQYSFNLAHHMHGAWYWIALIFLQDFTYYWAHRFTHVCRWGWASHVVHHSSRQYNIGTTLRQSPTYFLSGIWAFSLPLCFLGFKPEDVLAAGIINLVYQVYLHTQFIGKLGLLEYIFVTPSGHRVHHGKNRVYLDKNFGGIFIIWDRVFGTYAEEHEKIQYGMVKDIYTDNPISITFHEWKNMFKTVWKNRNPYLFISMRRK